MKSQAQLILEALQRGKRLTALDALEWFGCFRLSARIYDLRENEGWVIESRMITLPSGKTVAQYWLPKLELF